MLTVLLMENTNMYMSEFYIRTVLSATRILGGCQMFSCGTRSGEAEGLTWRRSMGYASSSTRGTGSPAELFALTSLTV